MRNGGFSVVASPVIARNNVDGAGGRYHPASNTSKEEKAGVFLGFGEIPTGSAWRTNFRSHQKGGRGGIRDLI